MVEWRANRARVTRSTQAARMWKGIRQTCAGDAQAPRSIIGRGSGEYVKPERAARTRSRMKKRPV